MSASPGRASVDGQGVLHIAQALGHPVPEHLTSDQEGALLGLAQFPVAVCTEGARLTLRKTGALDLVRWLRYTHFHAAKQIIRNLTEEQMAQALAVATAAGAKRGRPRSRKVPAATPPVQYARPRGRLCLACGSVFGLGDVCGCRRSENAGRCNN